MVNVFTLAFLGMFFLKGTGTPFFGAVPTWWALAIPLGLDAAARLLSFLNAKYGWAWKAVRWFERRGQKRRNQKAAEILLDKAIKAHSSDPSNRQK